MLAYVFSNTRNLIHNCGGYGNDFQLVYGSHFKGYLRNELPDAWKALIPQEHIAAILRKWRCDISAISNTTVLVVPDCPLGNAYFNFVQSHDGHALGVWVIPVDDFLEKYGAPGFCRFRDAIVTFGRPFQIERIYGLMRQ